MLSDDFAQVIEVAARDTRVAAVISQCPFTSGRSSAFTLGVLPTLKIVPLAIYDLVQSLFSNYVVPVQLAGRPGEGEPTSPLIHLKTEQPFGSRIDELCGCV